MLVFEKAVIKRYWPKEDQGEDGQTIHQVIMQAEAEIDNSDQIGALYTDMVRGLVHLSLMDNLTGEEYEIPSVTIKPFNIKQKKVTLSKGDEADVVKQEYVALSLVCRAREDDGATMLADLYRFFNIEIQLTFSEFRYQDTGTTDAEA